MASHRYQCPECSNQFTYLRYPSDAPEHPRFCPCCGYATDDQADGAPEPAAFEKQVSAPHIARVAGKAGDQVYRMMEQGADMRVKMAAEMTGQPDADFADMKITNLKDNLRAGDIAAIAPPANPVTQHMAAMAQQRGVTFGFGGNAAELAMGYASAVGSGPEPYAGMRFGNYLKQRHGAEGGVVTDAPAKEITSRFGGLR